MKKTEKKSKDDGEILVKEPLFTFASGFNAADRQSLRDSGPLSLDKEHIKYEQTIDELRGKISELQAQLKAVNNRESQGDQTFYQRNSEHKVA